MDRKARVLVWDVFKISMNEKAVIDIDIIEVIVILQENGDVISYKDVLLHLMVLN